MNLCHKNNALVDGCNELFTNQYCKRNIKLIKLGINLTNVCIKSLFAKHHIDVYVVF